MSPNRRAPAYALLVLALALLAVPAASSAASGGAAMGSGGGGLTQSGSGSATRPARSGGPVSASGDGISFTTRATTMFRNQLSFAGTTSRSNAGKVIEIERMGHQTAWQWAPTASATVAPNGSFSAVWHTNHIGRFSIRAVLAPAGNGTTAYAATAPPTVTITVFRSYIATQYGPGFYGHRTACGKRLTPTTIGVANRTLRCGTKVAIFYRGRTLVVPVIDRGPYSNGASWDLTMATGRALGIPGTARIGAVSLPRPPVS